VVKLLFLAINICAINYLCVTPAPASLWRLGGSSIPAGAG
jgi:hypothetical protein